MSQAQVLEFPVVETQAARLRVADLLSKGIFGALALLVIFTAIPYGTVEPWWKAVFICAVFAIFILAIIENLLSATNRMSGGWVLIPMLCLAAFAFLQTVSFRTATSDLGPAYPAPWNAISADPYQTRFVVLQLLALAACLALLYRYATTEPRIRVLVYVVIGVAVASAIFGILRQTTQHQTGFVLPLLKPGQGYGQFINKNHFAFLMEMAFGLGLGMILGGIKREGSMVYVALLLPIWTGLVLSNSRGGILAMLAQVVVAALLLMNSGSGSANNLAGPRFGRFVSSTVLRIVLLVVLVLGIAVGTVWVGGDRLVNTFEAVGGEFNPDAAGTNAGASRFEIWRASLRMFAANPILGAGLGGYWVGITRYHDASGTLTPQEAHNDYLELLCSGGVVGLALGIWFALVVLHRTRENLNSGRPLRQARWPPGDSGLFRRAVCFGAVIGISGVAVHSLVDFGLHMTANAVVFMTLIMMATAKVASGNRSSSG